MPGEFSGQYVRRRILADAADEPRGDQRARERRDVRRAATARAPDDAGIVGRVPGGRIGPHDDVLNQVADRDKHARAAGILNVTHYVEPISRVTRIRLSGLVEEPPPGAAAHPPRRCGCQSYTAVRLLPAPPAGRRIRVGESVLAAV